ncbi:jg19706 [Pararge aegeria aegeria]|uniref:Jg19706 protein n=1 Tax=Pararge aegeria aegeria TaxID=348720 RepID=A0A8S4R748_9NEOP|nr:jg19706 [Pararge aegeria aegeria]
MPVKIAPLPGDDVAMDKERKPIVRRPDVLRKLNAENLHFIERGLLGDLPDRFKPTPNYPVRGQSNELVEAKPTSLLSACLPVIPDYPSPTYERFSSDEEEKSPLKKSFSFRDKFRMSFFGKERRESVDKPKWNTIVEEEKAKELNPSLPGPKHSPRSDSEHKSHNRFWFFRNKAMGDRKSPSPIYTRSKSFEFLPRAIEEGQEKVRQKLKKNSLSYAFGSSDSVVDNISVESLEYIADVYSDKVNNVCLKSFKGLQEEDHYSSSTSTTASASASSGISINILKTESVQDLLDEFHKTVDMFSENYLSDSEPYTRTSKEVAVKEKRKSSSFNALPTPKIVQVAKVNKVSEDFKVELSNILKVKRVSECAKSARRGSVTDWFVLEDKQAPAPLQIHDRTEENKYRRAQKKETSRVRRISSTKYRGYYYTFDEFLNVEVDWKQPASLSSPAR